MSAPQERAQAYIGQLEREVRYFPRGLVPIRSSL